MLVLTRRADAENQSVVCIGSTVEVCVIEVKGDQVRIGISAPEDVRVDRKEIWLQRQADAPSAEEA